MTKKETIRKNIELTFDFVRQLIENPKLAESLPHKCEIEFIEKDYSLHTEKELKGKKLIKVEHNFKLIKGHSLPVH
jgi:hypothetical protein